ncbi:MAG: MBL fold metallo-hydrolase [Deltaproteobacteria bacterium]|nr:MBL fold metallo-hydrolase [Deltaproteobacteria bacterium]
MVSGRSLDKEDIVLTPLIPHMFLVEGGNQGRLPYAHAFLVTGDTTLLIDTGCGHETIRAIRREFPPDMVINTHAHPDHTSGNGLLEGLPLWVPEQRSETAGNLEKLGYRYSDETIAPIWIEHTRRFFDYRESTPTDTYGDGHVFECGEVKLRAIHAPGHNDDHYVFFEEQHGLLLSVDIDLTSFGPWYGNPESDIDLFKESVRRAIRLQPGIVASSHRSPERDDPVGALKHYLSLFERHERTILNLLPEPKTLEEIADAKPFYRTHPRDARLLRYFETVKVLKTLEHLEARGRVRREGKLYLRVD